MLLVTVVPL